MILKELRKQHNKTQNEIAKFLNIAQSFYQKLEIRESKEVPTEYLIKLANLYNVSVDFLLSSQNMPKKRGIQIPVLGVIPAGIPIEAIEEIIDYEEISTELAKTGDFFGLSVKGDSMNPRICNGDVVIVRKQDNAESSDICVIMVNGYDATLKQIKKDENGITLIPFNTTYKPMFYSNLQIEELPIKIIGKVVELRGKF